MNRTGLVLIGAAVIVVGYTLIYHAMGSDELASVNFRPEGDVAPGFIQLLVPGSIQPPGTGEALTGRRIGPKHSRGPHPHRAAR